MKADAKPTLAEIAALLSHPALPPTCVVRCLRYFIPLIGSRLPDDVDDVDRKLFDSADYLRRWLPKIYWRVEEQFGFEAPDWLDNLTEALDEAMPFLAADAARRRRGVKGGPTPNSSRELCAAVCLDIWRRLHSGASRGYSVSLWQACEAYWQACGWPETSTKSRLKNWEPFLVRVRSPPGDEVEVIDKFFRDHPVTAPK